VLAAHGQGDAVFGHVSAREAGADRFWMKPAGIGLEEAQPEAMLLVDLDGNVLDGDRPRHAEYPIHAEIMRARPDVNCVIHTHPRFGIALPVRGLRILPISQYGCYFWPGVPVLDDFRELVTTREQGEAVARRLGSAKAVLLLNHGVAVAGRSVEEACVSAVMLERACEVQLVAQPKAGSPVAEVGEAEARRVQARREENLRAVFDYHVRQLPSQAIRSPNA
jgi:L-fuculose-phosphate aldolase